MAATARGRGGEREQFGTVEQLTRNTMEGSAELGRPGRRRNWRRRSAAEGGGEEEGRRLQSSGARFLARGGVVDDGEALDAVRRLEGSHVEQEVAGIHGMVATQLRVRWPGRGGRRLCPCGLGWAGCTGKSGQKVSLSLFLFFLFSNSVNLFCFGIKSKTFFLNPKTLIWSYVTYS